MRILYRNPNKGYIGGVCHGLGVHTNVDPNTMENVFLIWNRVTYLYFIMDICK